MTPLDALLCLLKISLVGGIGLVAARLLVARRPATVPAIVLTALISSCVLMAVACVDWPVLWQSSLPTAEPPVAHLASPESQQATGG